MNSRQLILYILQIVAVINAAKLGWRIEKIGDKRYELTISLTKIVNLNLEQIVASLVCG